MAREKGAWKEKLPPMRLTAMPVIAIFILASLGALLTACGTEGQDAAGEADGLTLEMQAEKEIIEKAVQAFYKRTGRSEVVPRETPRQIGPWDVDVGFKGDIDMRLPTRYKIAWDVKGNITKVTE